MKHIAIPSGRHDARRLREESVRHTDDQSPCDFASVFVAYNSVTAKVTAMKYFLLLSATLILVLTQKAPAQLPPIPDMTLQCDGIALLVKNPTQQEYLVVNVTVLWEERNQRWTDYPEDLILRTGGKTRIPFSSFVNNFNAEKDAGMPSMVTLILLNENNKYVSLNFDRSPDGGYVPNEGRNTELTKLYQSMPVPDHQKSRR